MSVNVKKVVKKKERISATDGQRKIGMSKQVTINMGNYESSKIGVWMEMLVRDDDREINSAYDEISNMLEDQLEAETKGLK